MTTSLHVALPPSLFRIHAGRQIRAIRAGSYGSSPKASIAAVGNCSRKLEAESRIVEAKNCGLTHRKTEKFTREKAARFWQDFSSTRGRVANSDARSDGLENKKRGGRDYQPKMTPTLMATPSDTKIDGTSIWTGSTLPVMRSRASGKGMPTTMLRPVTMPSMPPIVV